MTSARIAEMREVARHLVRHPLVNIEDDPDMFTLIRRHHQELDRNFSQRFGYRLEVKLDSVRLYKPTVVTRRPFTAGSKKRNFKPREYTMLALGLAVMTSGQEVISLQHLVSAMRSAAVEAEVSQIEGSHSDRTAVVMALRWLISRGVVEESHKTVGGYAKDSSADAILTIHYDRVKLLPLLALSSSGSVEQLLDRSDRSPKARVRSFLLEEPAVYREDLTESEWREYRNYRYREEPIFEGMFGLTIETRAEGMVAIDEDGGMTDEHFPRGGGTKPQAALLLISQLAEADQEEFEWREVVEVVRRLAEQHRRYWSALAAEPEQLARRAVEILVGHRLLESTGDTVRLMPAAWRYAVEVTYEQPPLL